MSPVIAELIQSCEWAPSQFLVISDNVFSPLLYYSYLGSVIPTLLIALFIFSKGPKRLPNQLILLTALSFAAWVFGAMVTWATETPAYTMFFWTILVLVEPLVYFFAFYFFYAFIYKKDLSVWQKVFFAIPLIPVMVLAPTRFALLGYDLSNCDRNAYEGIATTYGYIIEILYAVSILLFAALAFIKARKPGERTMIALLTIGITAFLLSFSLGNILEVFTENWYIGQYGLFGAPIFTAFLAYLIVRFRAFNAKLIGAQALVAALWILVLALLFIRSVENIRVVVSITLIFVLILGVLLVRSVYREIQQRERVEVLAKDLETANQQQIILIHFITHQLKGFVTKSRNVFSMLLEGDFGSLPDTMKPMVEEGLRSDTKGVNTIQEILNAANIKSGKVTYAKSPLDLKELVGSIVADLKPGADTKGLALTMKGGDGDFTIQGDRMQLTNAFKNLIDNSIKYTPKGSVEVSLERGEEKVRLLIKDTGVGITPEDMRLLFTEGGHGKESQKVNVESTGFGLYIVKNIIEAHQGKVWAESDGKDQGSRFIVELPIS
ncbi:MAG: hypothetical protein QOE22_320 [Candidatus Parcubacteria bacterium]|jgi:signal transduction histidine kinase|nr:hypothetical protein [Candidatus Parcubacteria bacterium]